MWRRVGPILQKESPPPTSSSLTLSLSYQRCGQQSAKRRPQSAEVVHRNVVKEGGRCSWARAG